MEDRQMAENMTLTFAAAMKHFFGLKEGQTVGGFAQEIKALDLDDRAYFTKLLEGKGYAIVQTAVAA